MKKKRVEYREQAEDRLGCFGHFNPGYVLCSRRCAINLRCIVEKGYAATWDEMDEFAYPPEPVPPLAH